MGMQFDFEKVHAAIQEVKKIVAGHVRECANQTVAEAKTNSPVGWAKANPLPVTKTEAPRGYRGGTNRKSITADFSEGKGAVHTIGDMPSAGGSEGMPDGDNIGFRVYTQSGYGGWLEVGTKRMDARPYIAPGFEKAVNDLKRDLEGSV
ncbi:MAG: hypothetical protein HZB26_07265 [Candidatus Hydrogenedentes bacterium]|nr:hypothetical protein [Candidatus Hydrogenedentota bacterium]